MSRINFLKKMGEAHSHKVLVVTYNTPKRNLAFYGPRQTMTVVS